MPLPNINTSDTPLLIAYKQSFYEIVEALLEHSPKLFPLQAESNCSPFHEACSAGDIKMVQLFLKAVKHRCNLPEYKKQSLDFYYNGCTPFYIACENGLLNLVEILYKFHQENSTRVSLSVNATTKTTQRTPLHAAVQSGNIDLVKFLLSIKSIEINVEGYPSGSAEVELIEFHQKHAQGREIPKNCFKEKESIQEDEENDECQSGGMVLSRTFTSLASSTVQPVQAQRIKRNISTDFKAFPANLTTRRQYHSEQRTHQFICICEDSETGMLNFQLKNNEESQSKEFNSLLMTPLAEACAYYHPAIVELLLKQGAKDNGGLACRIAHLIQRPDLIQLILSYCTLLRDSNPSLAVNGDLSNVELNWSHLKLPHCEGKWLGNECKYHPLHKTQIGDTGYAPASKYKELNLGYDTVSVVHLDHNQLTDVPIELFQLQNVQFINLSNNKLACLPDESMNSREGAITGWSCPKLREINVSRNQLTCIPACLWKVTNIESIICSNNNLICLQNAPDNIPGDSQLKFVNFSSNGMSGTVSQFLFELPSLRVVDLSKNNIENLPSTVWNCATLNDLNLSNNQLKNLPLYMPEKASLRKKYSHSQGLGADQVLGGKAKMEAPTADQVVKDNTPLLAGMKITSVTQADKCIYSSLDKLDLSMNKLTSFPEHLACVAPNLTDLNVSINELKEIDVQFLPALLRKLTANNCGLTQIGNVHIQSKQNDINQNCGHADSATPTCQHRNHTQLPNLTTMDLTGNKIEQLQLIRRHAFGEEANYDKKEEVFCPNITPGIDLLYPALEYLYLAKNNLMCKFNPNIGHQMHLKDIQLRENPNLESLPDEFGFLKNKNLSTLSSDIPELKDKKLEEILAKFRLKLKP